MQDADSKASGDERESEGEASDLETLRKQPYPKDWWADEDHPQKMLPYGIEHRMVRHNRARCQ